MDYIYMNKLSYYDDNSRRIQFTILTKIKYSTYDIEKLLFFDYVDYLREHPSKKVSKNNIIKFLNECGIECVNRAYHKNKKNGKGI